MAGALVNVVLNFVLIPERGAMGAAVATLISYAAVYTIRAYDTRFYVKFDLHTARVLLNSTLLIFRAVVMINAVRYWRYIELGCIVAMLVINGREIFATVCRLGKKLLKKN